MNPIYKQATAQPADPIGGKARSLAALNDAGFPIPPWFALSPTAFHLNGNGNGHHRGTVELTSPALESLKEALGEICPDKGNVAVRSSAMEEDGAENSFAGQLQSFLSVPCEDVPSRAVAVWKSAFTEPAARYREARGLDGAPPPPAVLVQRMVDADIAGVAFGADPVTGRRDQVVISAVVGLGEKLVSGEVEGQTSRVDANDAIVREGSAAPILSETQGRAVAALTRRAGAHFGCPQDVEWAIAGGELFLLQSRPITNLGAAAADRGAPDASGHSIESADEDRGTRAIWDNSNIVESYRGMTSPLTFTFARGAYEGVYRQFCRILRVPSATIDANDETFKGMLGWINGRIYYNLLNWYRVLAMLPGYKLNRRFMEQMMGVKEGLPDALADEIANSNESSRLADGFRALVSIGGLIAGLAGLKSRTRAFYRRLEDALRPAATPLESMSPAELAAHYRDLEDRLLTRWDAPLLNDFFCMIFYGVLKQLTAKWCAGETLNLHDELLQGSGRMISAEPAARLRELASIAAGNAEFARLLVDAPLEKLHPIIERSPEFRASYSAYLEKFGERCTEELKLETPTLHDDPLPLLRAIGHFAKANPANKSPSETAAESDAEARLESALAGHPLRGAVLRWVLKQARNRVRERENLRFERTRVFGRVRRIVVELGKRFHAEGRLAAPRDVFYLELDTVLEAAAAHGGNGSGNPDFAQLVDAAKEEENRFRELPAPPSRFETRGSTKFFVAPAKSAEGAAPDSEGDAERRGLGCSPGVARGIVRVVRDPRNAGLEAGEILVAESTDPGWILLFPLAAGLVVERGSPLSHSAIVARELGIPAVVSLENATGWLSDGDEVELDGATGMIRILSTNH